MYIYIHCSHFPLNINTYGENIGRDVTEITETNDVLNWEGSIQMAMQNSDVACEFE